MEIGGFNLKNIIAGLKNKKVRYGAFSTLTSIMVISVLIIVNIVASNFNKTFDLTPQKQFSIGEDSIEILNNVNIPINIYYLAKTGEEEVFIDTMIKDYIAHSSNITYEIKDPYIYAGFTNQFKTNNEDIAVGSVIIQSEKRFKVIPASSFVSQSYNGGTSIDIEPQITNGIRYVSQDETSTLYYVTGHDEMEIATTISEQIKQANYDLLPLELFTTEIPENADALILTIPSRDYSEQEVEKVQQYLLNGGATLIVSGNVGDALPNFSKIYNDYGIQMNNGIAIETDTNRIAATYSGGSNPTMFYPFYTDHEIGATLNTSGIYTFSQSACGISLADLTRQSVKVEDVLVTSESSYIKTSYESQTISKEEGDIDGPASLVVAVTDSQAIAGDTSSKLIISSMPYLMATDDNTLSGGGNGQFVLNSLNWLAGNEDNVYISSYIDNTQALSLTATNALVITLYSLIILPLVVVIIGLVIWLRRRNK